MVYGSYVLVKSIWLSIHSLNLALYLPPPCLYVPMFPEFLFSSFQFLKPLSFLEGSVYVPSPVESLFWSHCYVWEWSPFPLVMHMHSFNKLISACNIQNSIKTKTKLYLLSKSLCSIVGKQLIHRYLNGKCVQKVYKNYMFCPPIKGSYMDQWIEGWP